MLAGKYAGAWLEARIRLEGDPLRSPHGWEEEAVGFYSDFLIEQLDGFDDFIDEVDPEVNVTPEDRALEKEIEGLCRAVVQGKGDWFLPVDAGTHTRAKRLEGLSDKFTIFFERIIV